MSGWDDDAPAKGADSGWATGEDHGSEEAKAPRPSPFPHLDAPAGQWEETKAYSYDKFVDDANGEWDGNAEVYHYDGENGDVGPKIERLEIDIFGKADERDSGGIEFDKITTIQVNQEGVTRIEPIKSFNQAGLHPVTLENIELCGYRVPTPIQQYCIVAGKKGHDLIAVAQTGSGKTAAYLIPILDSLMGKAKRIAAPRPHPELVKSGQHPGVMAEPLVIIVCPTRELGVQIFNEARKFCYRTMLRPAVIYGGAKVPDQIQSLKYGCDILVCTPGRMVDMMQRPHVLSLRRVRHVVIDEADEMLTDSWSDNLNTILSGGDQEEGNIKYMLFSATFPPRLKKLAEDYLAANHVRIEVGRAGSSHENVRQDVVWVDDSMKRVALLDYLMSLEPGRCIVFVNHKQAADEIDDFIFGNKLPCTSMHADRTQREREDALRNFRKGTTPIMVTTGISARGIDVRNVKYVINYDLPSVDHGGIEEYVHRIGRTGRIGHVGDAMSFYNDRDEGLAPVLTKLLLETKQEVPDFLQQYMPEGDDLENLKFYEDPVEEADNNGGGWGESAGDPWATGDDSQPAGGNSQAAGGPSLDW